MSEFPNKVNQALLDNDNESLIHLINKSVNDETSLRIFLQLVFQFIVRNKRLIDDNPPIDHPIVFLNSIKNVLSLRRNDPSTRLLIYLIEYVLNLESKKSELQWATVSDKELIKKAKKYMHMTSTEAALIASKSNTKQLVLTHFSNRYKETHELEKEARTFFDKTSCAKDFMKISL